MIPRAKAVKYWSTFWSLVLIAILVVLVRVAAFSVDTTQAIVKYDVDCYLEIARNVVAGKGYSLLNYSTSAEPVATAMRGPTVVYFFAMFLWLGGDHTWLINIAQWLADAGTAVILFYIAIEIFRDRRVAFLASLLFAFYEPGLIFTFRGYSEPVFTLVLAGFTLSLLHALRRMSAWRYVLSGALLGLAVMARPAMQFYPLVVLFLIWLALKQGWPVAMSRFAIFFLAFAAMLCPWVLRNYQVFKAFIPGSSYSGCPFFESNFALEQQDYLRFRGTEQRAIPLRQALEANLGPAPNSLDSRDYHTYTSQELEREMRTRGRDPFERRIDPVGNYARAKGLNELDVDRFAFREGLSAVRTHAGRYVVLSIVRLFRIWFDHRFVNYLIFGGELPRAWLVAAANAALLALAVYAFVWFRVPWLQPAVISLIALVAYNTAIYAATQAVGRYSAPVAPYVMVFAAFTLVQLLPQKDKSRDHSECGVTSAALHRPNSRDGMAA